MRVKKALPALLDREGVVRSLISAAAYPFGSMMNVGTNPVIVEKPPPLLAVSQLEQLCTLPR